VGKLTGYEANGKCRDCEDFPKRGKFAARRVRAKLKVALSSWPRFHRVIEESDRETYKNSSGDEIANVNFFYNIAHVEASGYAH